jgi:hypothetical protein
VFLSKPRISISGSKASQLGIDPERLLKDRSNTLRFLRLLKESGTGPVRLRRLSVSEMRCMSLEMEVGTGPVIFVNLWNSRVLR